MSYKTFFFSLCKKFTALITVEYLGILFVIILLVFKNPNMMS